MIQKSVLFLIGWVIAFSIIHVGSTIAIGEIARLAFVTALSNSTAQLFSLLSEALLLGLLLSAVQAALIFYSRGINLGKNWVIYSFSGWLIGGVVGSLFYPIFLDGSALTAIGVSTVVVVIIGSSFQAWVLRGHVHQAYLWIVFSTFGTVMEFFIGIQTLLLQAFLFGILINAIITGLGMLFLLRNSKTP